MKFRENEVSSSGD